MSQEEATPASSDVILNSLESAVLVFTAGGIVSYANSAAEQLFDTSINQLRGQDLNNILPVGNSCFFQLDLCDDFFNFVINSDHFKSVSTIR